ncbi:MAG: hypothetical protein QOG78_2248, partial [Rhodospirillaceae bacterium]|nr:hypothetical protein [Rhodospirillaceae bacterium]
QNQIVSLGPRRRSPFEALQFPVQSGKVRAGGVGDSAVDLVPAGSPVGLNRVKRWMP